MVKLVEDNHIPAINRGTIAVKLYKYTIVIEPAAKLVFI